MQKIKEKLHIGRNKHHEGEYAEGVDNTYNTGGVAGTGVAGTGATGLAANSMNTSLSGSSGYQEGVVERPVGVGVAEVPVVVTEQERLGMGGGVGGGMGEEVCGTKTFTEVEDRPIVKERVERVLEHRPVEKQYVVETRFVGENAVPSATGATVIDTTERVVEAAEPGPRCPANAGQMMDNVIGGMGTGGVGGAGTGGVGTDAYDGVGTGGVGRHHHGAGGRGTNAYDGDRRI
jgi:hypothetical protein